MRRRVILVVIIVLAFGASYVAKRAVIASREGVHVITQAGETRHREYTRIVSMSPSITETLFALGLGDRVVGITRYCGYPPEALTRTKIGGYLDPDYETIISLRPDLIIMFPESKALIQHLSGQALDVLVVDHRDISDILDSITKIGKVCGAGDRAREIVRDIRQRMEDVGKKTVLLSESGKSRPKVMICVGRDMGSGSINDVYISGKEGFYNKMITLAGGENVYKGKIEFPSMSVEAILRLNPEVIIDMVANLDKEKGLNRAGILRQWQTLSSVDAVRNGRVYIFSQGYEAIPGPRFILTLEQMARVIHPDLR